MGNAGVCQECGGKGWLWTGAWRQDCRRCNATGRAVRFEDRDRGPARRSPDPVLTRLR